MPHQPHDRAPSGRVTLTFNHGSLSVSSTRPSTFRLRRRTPGSFVLVPCARIGRALRCQGQLERAAARVIAACPQVIDIQEQPMEIWYSWRETDRGLRVRLLDEPPETRTIDGQRVSYIVPDFLVAMRNGASRLIEVKPARKLGKEIVRRKLLVARLYALKSGWTFHVLTEQELLSGSLPRIVSLIARYRVIRSDASLCDALRRRVPTKGITIGELIERTEADATDVRTHVYHLLAVEELSFDPSAGALSNDTPVFPKGAVSWDPFDSVWASSSCSTGGPIEWSANSPMTALFPKT